MHPIAGSLRKYVTEAVEVPFERITEESDALAISYSPAPSSAYKDGETARRNDTASAGVIEFKERVTLSAV